MPEWVAEIKREASIVPVPPKRALATLALLLLFTVIQTWAPLLHAHVQPVPDILTGIHLPDGTSPAALAINGSPAASVGPGCGMLITAQTQISGPEPGAAGCAADTAPAPDHPAAAARLSLHRLPSPRNVRTGRRDAAPPFPVGPPATA